MRGVPPPPPPPPPSRQPYRDGTSGAGASGRSPAPPAILTNTHHANSLYGFSTMTGTAAHTQLARPSNFRTNCAPGTAPYGYDYSDRNSATLAVPPKPHRAREPRSKQHAKGDESPAFPCDICPGMFFESATALSNHVQTHTVCKRCDYTACPKLVKAHFQQAHGKFAGSGFKVVTVEVPGIRPQRFRICVGNRPEDVQRWIEERRKRFPRFAREGGREKKQEEKPKATISQSAVDAKKEETAGLSSLLDGYGSSSSDEDGEVGEKKPTRTVEGIKNGVEDGSGLGDMNGQKDTPADKAPEISCLIKTAKMPGSAIISSETNARSPQKRRICRYFARNGTCRHGENCNFLHEEQRQPQAKRSRQPQTSRQTGLLSNLLANDIRRERMITLNLLRYIADQRYFQEDTNRSGDGE